VREQHANFAAGGVGGRRFGDAEAAELFRHMFDGGGATGSGFIVGCGTTTEEFGFGYGELKREKVQRRRRERKNVEEVEVSCRKQHYSRS